MIAYCGPAICARSACSLSAQGCPSRVNPCDACVAPPAASFRDPLTYISIDYARSTIAEICSLGAALVTALISQTGSCGTRHHR